MKKRKVASILLAAAIATTLLTGCDNTGATMSNSSNSYAVEQVASQETQIPKTKTYAPYEHVFYVRYSNLTNKRYSEKVSGGQIEIPERYEILEIENWNKEMYKSSQTGGFDVWFINNKPVEVQSVYNESTGGYDYSTPGTVIEMELEEEGPTKVLTP